VRPPIYPCQSRLNERFGVRSGDEDRGGNIKVEAAKFLAAQNVRDAVARGAAGEERAVLVDRVRRYRVGAPGEQAGTVYTEGDSTPTFRSRAAPSASASPTIMRRLP
jgi:hypothetical protein